jgi:hypothetical protein
MSNDPLSSAQVLLDEVRRLQLEAQRLESLRPSVDTRDATAALARKAAELEALCHRLQTEALLKRVGELTNV